MGDHRRAHMRRVSALLSSILPVITTSARPQQMIRHNITLATRTHEYDNTHTFHFKPSDNTQDLRFEAGMYVHLVAPGASSLGRDTVRHMSFASAPEEGDISFSMDLGSESGFKKAMAALQPGDVTQIFKIKFKHFEIDPESQQEVVFLAGGLGITPIRSILKSQKSSRLDWQLIHVARDEKHLYADELVDINSSNIQVRTDHAGAEGAVLRALKDKPNAWFYICGSARFVQGMQDILEDAGVSTEKLRIESFN